MTGTLPGEAVYYDLSVYTRNGGWIEVWVDPIDELCLSFTSTLPVEAPVLPCDCSIVINNYTGETPCTQARYNFIGFDQEFYMIVKPVSNDTSAQLDYTMELLLTAYTSSGDGMNKFFTFVIAVVIAFFIFCLGLLLGLPCVVGGIILHRKQKQIDYYTI